jgi:hypothetical protein
MVRFAVCPNAGRMQEGAAVKPDSPEDAYAEQEVVSDNGERRVHRQPVGRQSA